MKLYGSKGCGSVIVELMLELAHIEYTFIDAIQWQPFTRHPDLLKLNPLGQVPVLVLDDGSVMTESAAIVLWLAEKIPGMIPPNPSIRAVFQRWMIFVPANMYAVFAFRDFPQRWVDGDVAQAQFKEKLTERLRECWRVLESELKPSPYLLGADMCALDPYLAMLGRWTPGREWITTHCPHVAASLARTEQHPAVNAMWKRNFTL